MKKSEKAFNILKEHKLIALLAPKSVENCITAYEILSPIGIMLEIAFRTEIALEGIKATLKKYPDALILAGTVMTQKQASEAIEAGVAGIVSADYIPGVVELCVKNDIMCIPGGLGDVGKQLVQKAELYQCDFESLREKYPYQWIYKLFPAATDKMIYVDLSKAWKSAFKGLNIVYTGGISLTNLREIVQWDPDGIICGSALTKLIDEPNKMREEAKKWQEMIKMDPKRIEQ